MSNEVLELLQQLSKTQTQQQQRPDPSQIYNYNEAMKYIAKYMSNDDYVLDRIRHMIKEQQRREAEWMAQRSALIDEQTTKGSNRQELERVLRLVGGATNSISTQNPATETELENTKELLSFDARIHANFEQLMRSQEDILAELRVPLFCTAIPVTIEDKVRIAEFLKQLAT